MTEKKIETIGGSLLKFHDKLPDTQSKDFKLSEGMRCACRRCEPPVEFASIDELQQHKKKVHN